VPIPAYNGYHDTATCTRVRERLRPPPHSHELRRPFSGSMERVLRLINPIRSSVYASNDRFWPLAVVREWPISASE